jgi:hypothetical protein
MSCGKSRTGIALVVALSLIVAIAFLNFATVGSSTARAAGICSICYSCCENFPITNSVYQSNNFVTFPGSMVPL